MRAPTVTASSSDNRPTPELTHLDALGLLGWPGYSREQLGKAADAKARLQSQAQRARITRKKLARAEELPSSCRCWGQTSGLLAECGQDLSLLQVDVLVRFAAVWAKQQSGTFALSRYSMRIQASRTHHGRRLTKLEKLCGYLIHTTRKRAEEIGRALNADGRAWLRADFELRRNERELRKEEAQRGLPVGSLRRILFNRDQFEQSREMDRKNLADALRVFADELLRILEKHPEEKLLRECNEDGA